MRRFLIKMALSLIFLGFFSMKFVDVTIGEQMGEYPLETAWKTTGINLTEVTTDTWMRLNNRWLSQAELKETAKQIKNKLHLNLKTDLIAGQQAEFTYVSFEGWQRDGTVVTVTLQSSRSEYLNETQLGVSTVKTGGPENLRNYMENLQGMLACLGSSPNTTIMLQGERQGRFSSQLVRELSGRAFRRVKADLVRSAYQDGISSQKGYTKLLKEVEASKLERVNIELSTRYDPSCNLTQVIIATPQLNGDV